VIETIRQGFPLNVMYWAVLGNGRFEIIDGQQRTISICQYVQGDFSIGDIYFHNLQSDQQEIILNYELMVYVCEGTDTEKLDERSDRRAATALDEAPRPRGSRHRKHENVSMHDRAVSILRFSPRSKPRISFLRIRPPGGRSPRSVGPRPRGPAGGLAPRGGSLSNAEPGSVLNAH